MDAPRSDPFARSEPWASSDQAARFELIERIGADSLARHPAWTHYEPEIDRARLLAWGVTLESIQRAAEHLVACGLIPLYPVLEPGELTSQKDVMIAARFTPEGRAPLEGYLLEPHAFGIFLGGHEYSFNRNLPGFSGREAERLARALDLPLDELFPLAWSLDPRLEEAPGEHDGSIAVFW